MRRSLTITPENERRIQGLRSTTLGLETPVDLDYTTATNMLVEIGFLTLEQMGTPPLDESSGPPSVRLPAMEVVQVLFRYIFQSLTPDTVQDQSQWKEELIEKEGGVELLMSFRKLPAFQPKKPPQEPPKQMAASHATVKG